MARKKTPKTIAGRLRARARRVLVPHHTNQFRPHLIRWRGLVVVALLVTVLQVGAHYMTTGDVAVLGNDAAITLPELIADTNDERTKAGQSALTVSDKLNRAAYEKAKDMIANDYWAHVSPSGVTPWKWLSDQDYNYQMAGENLAKNYPSAGATVDAWMRSPTHRDNLLNADYTEVGIAVVDGLLGGQNTTLVVAYYGKPVADMVPVAGTIDRKVFTTADTGTVGVLGTIGSAVRSLNPATVGAIGILLAVALVGATAHRYRRQLPKAWRKSWKLHHGAYTFVGAVVVVVLIVAGAGGGQL